MRAWALRAVETGLYLPWGAHNRNNSWEEFTSIDRPRLFTSKRAAYNTLTTWRFGRWKWCGYGEDSNLEPLRTPTKRDFLVEVVEFELKEIVTYVTKQ